MESSAGTVRSHALAKQEGPGWLWMTIATLCCLVVSGVALALALQLPARLHLLPDEAAFGQLGWPWPATDAWSLMADLGQGLLFGFAFAGLLRVAVRREAGWDLQLWPVAAAAALGMASRPENGPGLLILALIVVVAKAVALRPAASEPAPRRPARQVALAVVGAALLIASFTYQPAHPLIASFADRETPLSPYELNPLRPSDRRLGFVLLDEGLGVATVHEVRALGSKTAAVKVVTDRGRPFAGTRMTHGEPRFGKVVLPKAACSREPLIGDVPAVVVYDLEVRLETLGTMRTQRFAVSPPARLYCR